jgi:hypothetical protein
MAATNTGKTAARDGRPEGGDAYSPSQSLEDWSSNLDGVKRLMNNKSAIAAPLHARKEAEPPAGDANRTGSNTPDKDASSGGNGGAGDGDGESRAWCMNL